jgi:GT2 family glycosyltransferase
VSSIEISVVIPTRNRPTQLVRCLDALAKLQTPTGRFEVIVVDDGSDRLLNGVVEPFHPVLNLVLIRKPNGGAASARNEGAAAARGRLLAFLDDDCAPHAQWLNRLADCLRDNPGCMTGGHVVNVAPGLFSEASHLLLEYLYDYFNDNGRQCRFFASCNIGVDAERFRALGGFDESYPRAAAEDRDLCDRWLASGYRMAYSSDAMVEHSHALDLKGFCRQHFDYGRGARRFRDARAARGAGSVRLEPLRFYTGLLLLPFRSRGVRRPVSMCSLLVVSQAANVAGFLYECTKTVPSQPARKNEAARSKAAN